MFKGHETVIVQRCLLLHTWSTISFIRVIIYFELSRSNWGHSQLKTSAMHLFTLTVFVVFIALLCKGLNTLANKPHCLVIPASYTDQNN